MIRTSLGRFLLRKFISASSSNAIFLLVGIFRLALYCTLPPHSHKCLLRISLRSELRHVIANIGEKVDEDELEDMMKEADKDGNGKIDYNEFVATVLKPVDVPPQVLIPPELKPYMDQVLQKEAKKHHGSEAVEAS